MIEIINSGERILLDKETPLMIARHFCAYKFAKDYVSNKSVLDIGCGEGYGANYLARFAKEVVGLDYDEAIINYARNKYPKTNLRFCKIEVNGLNSMDNKFDIICSFQVIEHIRDTEAFLRNINHLLKDNGIFICSTPNKKDASPRSNVPLNKFHIKEYLWGEFKELLELVFKEVDILGLKRGRGLSFYRRLKKIGLFNFLPIRMNPVKRFYGRIDCDNFIIIKDNIDSALDFIAVCKKIAFLYDKK